MKRVSRMVKWYNSSVKIKIKNYGFIFISELKAIQIGNDFFLVTGNKMIAFLG